MPVKTTTTFAKIMLMTKKIKVIQGGQSAGKNYAIAQILIKKALTENIVITIMTDTYDNLKDGIIMDMKNIFQSGGLNWDSSYNKSSKDLNIGKSLIQFRYISDNREYAGKSKRRDVLYLNEGNKIGWGVASTYIGRTHGEVYIDHNPDFEYWAHTEVPKLHDLEGNTISEQIIVTYRDNEFCPDSEIEFIEARKSKVNWYNIYGLGLTGTYSERRILDYDFIDEIPPTAKRIQSGLDFGVHPDPTILIDLYLDRADLYCDERFCMNYLMPEKIEGAKRMSIVDQLNLINYPKGNPIVADSAGGSEIRDLRKHGYYVIGANKPRGSLVDGLNKLRGYNLKLTKRSVNLKEGIESYFWKLDKDNKIIPEPYGHEPDGVAATRYGVSIIR